MRDERASEQKFTDNIAQETKTNKMWKAEAKKAGWKQNLMPISIKSGPNLITNMKGVADTIYTYYHDKIDALNNAIPRTEFDPITMLQQKMFR